MSSVGDLFVMLGFKVDDKQLKGFDNSIKSLRNNMAGMVAETIGAVYAIDKFTSGIAHSLQGAQNLSNFTRQTGLDNYKAQIWGVTGTLDHMGVKAEETQNALFNLNEQLASIRRGESAPSAAMGQIGITGADDAYTAWEKIRQARQTFPQFQGAQGQANFTSFLQSLGVPTGLAPAFKMSFDEQERRVKETGNIKSEEDIAKQNEANDALQQTNAEFTGIYNTLATDLIPEIKTFNSWLHDFAVGLHYLISQKPDENYPAIAKDKANIRAEAGLDKPEKDRSLYNHVYDTVYNNGLTRWMEGAGGYIDKVLADTGATPNEGAGAPTSPTQLLMNPAQPILAPKQGLNLPQGRPDLTLTPNIDDNETPISSGLVKQEDFDKVFKNLQAKPAIGPQSSNSTSYQIKIDVNGAESPRETAAEVARQLEYTISMNQFANGGVA